MNDSSTTSTCLFPLLIKINVLNILFPPFKHWEHIFQNVSSTMNKFPPFSPGWKRQIPGHTCGQYNDIILCIDIYRSCTTHVCLHFSKSVFIFRKGWKCGEDEIYHHFQRVRVIRFLSRWKLIWWRIVWWVYLKMLLGNICIKNEITCQDNKGN